MDGVSILRYFSNKQNAEGKQPSLAWQAMLFPFHETKAGGLQCCEHHTALRQCRSWGGCSSWPQPRAAQAADQCHLEESSIVLILVSSIPNMLFHTVQNRQKFCPVFSAVTFYCFSCFVSCTVQTSDSPTESTAVQDKWRRREEQLGCREFKEIPQNKRESAVELAAVQISCILVQRKNKVLLIT